MRMLEKCHNKKKTNNYKKSINNNKNSDNSLTFRRNDGGNNITGCVFNCVCLRIST